MPTRKLSKQDIEVIEQLIKEKVPFRVIAERFNICKGSVGNISRQGFNDWVKPQKPKCDDLASRFIMGRI